MTKDEIKQIDDLAEQCRYKAPPGDLEPADRDLHRGDHEAWRALSDWFEDNTHSWHSAMLVYLARLKGITIPQAYIYTDSWAKREIQRRDIRDDLTGEAEHAYGN
jgi:hypothetical protein|tara:strand:- start:19246 stop:19560 length:315 start_codon:yes stop_codon:yes gene_type:complete